MKISDNHNKKILGIAEIAMNELQPIAEKTTSDLMDFAKEAAMIGVASLFNKGRDTIEKKKGLLNGEKQ